MRSGGAGKGVNSIKMKHRSAPLAGGGLSVLDALYRAVVPRPRMTPYFLSFLYRVAEPIPSC
jgi:hypothetical protein